MMLFFLESLLETLKGDLLREFFQNSTADSVFDVKMSLENLTHYYVGCYGDGPSRHLTYQLFLEQNNTNELCVKSCYQIDSKYIYSGTEYS